MCPPVRPNRTPMAHGVAQFGDLVGSLRGVELSWSGGNFSDASRAAVRVRGEFRGVALEQMRIRSDEHCQAFWATLPFGAVRFAATC